MDDILESALVESSELDIELLSGTSLADTEYVDGIVLLSFLTEIMQTMLNKISTSKFIRPSGFLTNGLLRALSSRANQEPLVLSEYIESGVQVLTLNNATRANCLSLRLIKELHKKIKEVKELDNVRALIIRGGGQFFSAGHDLNELVEGGAGSRADLFSACSHMMLDLAKLQIPSIAAVHGPAHAAGCQLVATCDLAVAGESATFATSGIKLGLFCSTPAIALVRAIGLRAAKEMLFTGHSIDANRAYELGLVHRVVADEQVFEASLELAREISQHNRPVICMGKRGLTAQASMDISDAYDVATQVMLHNLELEDTQRGIKSFINKQPLPVWTHKSD
ncbi:uncharacterized protein DEA37_0002004 [Paragonimus westermani]|uniref:Enoyl-CoA hydratase domain-containing protein 3, mitochondrial n=1 Tax=Paragonimus westermani TaxID=34504 RepID=A0A5J4ND16_9TREM|nr:uncharacterized protein DEA37_0002004 [Paragonimus westermani]